MQLLLRRRMCLAARGQVLRGLHSSGGGRSAPPRSGGNGPPQGAPREEMDFGPFQHTHLKNFPVRAAIDIGTGGVISLAIARVDADKAAITKLLYATQLPLYLEATSPSSASVTTSSSSSSSSNGSVAGAFALSEKTLVDVRNKMRVLSGAMRRDAYEGLSERAAVLSHPLCLADNAQQLADELTKEFKVQVLVLGKSFHVSWPWLPSEQAQHDAAQSHDPTAEKPSPAATEGVPRASKGTRRERSRLKHLLRTHQQKQQHEEKDQEGGAARVSASSTAAASTPTDEQVKQLAFLAHAAAAQCVAPQRMLVVSEDAQKGLSIVGTDTSAMYDVQDLLSAGPADREEQQRLLEAAGLSQPPSRDDAEHGQAVHDLLGLARSQHARHQRFGDAGREGTALVPAPTAGIGLVEHRLPMDAAEAHRLCVVDIQRRPVESYRLHSSSPNPLLRDEWVALRNHLIDQIEPTLPEWVRRKAALGGVIATTSFNGGVMNLAARVAQRAPIPLEHMEVNAQFHFCGLTDVLLAASFPNPVLVLPSTALAAALMRALHTPRVSYLPELSVATALLVQPDLWLRPKAASVRAKLRQDAFYTDVKQRTFRRPHVKSHPTAAPDTAWPLGDRWNELSFENSTRGT